MIKISEIFGPTVQGEGAAAGRHCMFVRVALCNLECHWCDTDYTWAFTERKASLHRNGVVHDMKANLRNMNAGDIILELCDFWDVMLKPTIVVISGGEPLVQSDALGPLAYTLTEHGNEVHVETAGTLVPTTFLDSFVTQYNVSPKLENSHNSLDKRYVPVALNFFAGDDRAWFKFVITHPDDFEEVDFIVSQHNINRRRIMVMPEGVTIDDNIDTARMIVDQAVTRGWGLTFRSHILLWKDTRGK